MLQFLVTSKARRRLLSLLWGEGRQGSVSELAEMASVAFGSAYRELHEMRRHQLARSEMVDGVEVFSADQSHPGAEVLRQLAHSRPRPGVPRDEESDALRRRLRALGVPLSVAPEEVPAEERASTLARGVRLARRDPVLARVLPLGFWHQREVLDAEALALAARQVGAKQATGFMLDLTSELSHDPRFRRWARRLRDRRVKAQHPFFELPPAATHERDRSESPAAALRWNFRLEMDLESLRSQFDKFVHDGPRP
jgi:hypothetical protein